MHCEVRTLGVCLDLATSSISFKNNEQLADQTLPPLSHLNYNKLSREDILNLFPRVTSSEFLNGKLTLSIEHTFSVSGPAFSPAARKISLEKQHALDRHLDDMLRQGIIEYSRSPYIRHRFI